MAKKKQGTSAKKKTPAAKNKTATKPKGTKKVEKKENVKVEEKTQKSEGKKTEKPKKTSTNKRKTCEKCGASLPARAKFCLECGNYLGEKEESFITPNKAGMPGVMPIPESAKFQNVVGKEKMLNSSKPTSKKKSNFSFYLLCTLLVVVSLIMLFFFDGTKKEPETKEPTSSNSSSNPSKVEEKPKEEEPTQILECSIKEDYGDGITGLSNAKYYYLEDTLIKVEEEESVSFTDAALIYYSFYEQSLKEELESDEFQYDNTSLELKKEKNSIGLLYTIDLRADSSNANNLLDLVGTSYQQAKKNLEKEGYTCK